MYFRTQRRAKMISVMFKVDLTNNNGWKLEFCPEFESLNSQQKLDLIQDVLYDLNVKYKDVNENY
jgi:hypothetical protein